LSRTVIEIGRAKLHAEYAGTIDDEKTPMVFLHAGVADTRMWPDVLSFGRDRLCVVYDRRGFGKTQSPDEPFSHAADLGRVLDSFGKRRAILVGCSQGGRIAIDFALANPGRVSGLVLVSTAISGDQWPETLGGKLDELVAEWERVEATADRAAMNEFEARVWLDGPLAPPGRVAKAQRQIFLAMNQIVLEREGTLSSESEPPSALGALASIEVPTLVVSGGFDFPHIVGRCLQIANKIPGAKCVELPDVAHLPPLEAPAAFTSLLADFVQSAGL